MRFILEIECDNAAFRPDVKREIARILHAAAQRFEIGITGDSAPLFDFNGNKVGKWSITQ